MIRRYPGAGEQRFATGKAGEDILAKLGVKNIRWFELVTKVQVPVRDNSGREYKGKLRQATQTYAYEGSGMITTPSEERGMIDALILGAETEYYVEFESYCRQTP